MRAHTKEFVNSIENYGLTIAEFDLLDDQLSNNDSCSDEELMSYFVENGIPVHIAREALDLRSEFFANCLIELTIDNGKLSTEEIRVRLERQYPH